jgi:hypothetical protein
LVSIRRYKKKSTKLGMKYILRKINSRKEIWFSSMTVNTCNTREVQDALARAI